MSKERTRRVRISFGWCEAAPRWSKSTLTFGVWKDNTKHEAVISIEDPTDLRYIRSQLDEIERYWQKQISGE